MNSKEAILKKIKNGFLEKVELKEIDFELSRFEEKIEAFKDALKAAGGEAKEIKKEDIPKELEEYKKDSFLDFSFCKEKNEKNITIKNPKELKDIKTVIVEGRFGVCENGAIWCDSEDVDIKTVYFICENLIILLDKNRLLNNMNEAFKELDFESFGVFISGPSKTADIEQSLVIGAHGALKCIVFLY
ncbi:MAG: hypothetical protein GXO12_03255 [Epsilonproteobacteria bacterium]|nr:hypothetical protein [Campylobacterota bacterium]